MERISVFDIFKIGIGPSSSHTMGPWKAANEFISELETSGHWDEIVGLNVELFGSLAKTGKGHGTDLAVILGLQNYLPQTIPLEEVESAYLSVLEESQINLGGKKYLPFRADSDIIFHMDQSLPYHSNGITFRCFFQDETSCSSTFYSVGGGFVVKEGDDFEDQPTVQMPFPIDRGEDLQNWCIQTGFTISEVVFQNELSLRSEEQIKSELFAIWEVMKTCIYESCHKEGELPGGLNVQRRAKALAGKLMEGKEYANVEEWIENIKKGDHGFSNTLKWLSCFALAVNEENAAFGRIVTAPTNGAAGVIPAVLMYHLCFNETAKDDDVVRFLLTAGEFGSLFKKGATISAAMGGCQAEIGVSSAMAAGALTEVLGGSFEQAMMAAEIAMEHHLGMTCDPIGGLVQVPCIERNTMGAIKAVTAAQIAMESDPSKALVSLDAVIKTMKETALDMNTKYKETSDGGLALHIAVNLVEC
jgi:L-serine dehydratase